jgi:hypothetical protein
MKTAMSAAHRRLTGRHQRPDRGGKEQCEAADTMLRRRRVPGEGENVTSRIGRWGSRHEVSNTIPLGMLAIARSTRMADSSRE